MQTTKRWAAFAALLSTAAITAIVGIMVIQSIELPRPTFELPPATADAMRKPLLQHEAAHRTREAALLPDEDGTTIPRLYLSVHEGDRKQMVNLLMTHINRTGNYAAKSTHDILLVALHPNFQPCLEEAAINESWPAGHAETPRYREWAPRALNQELLSKCAPPEQASPQHFALMEIKVLARADDGGLLTQKGKRRTALAVMALIIGVSAAGAITVIPSTAADNRATEQATA